MEKISKQSLTALSASTVGPFVKSNGWLGRGLFYIFTLYVYKDNFSNLINWSFDFKIIWLEEGRHGFLYFLLLINLKVNGNHLFHFSNTWVNTKKKKIMIRSSLSKFFKYRPLFWKGYCDFLFATLEDVTHQKGLCPTCSHL